MLVALCATASSAQERLTDFNDALEGVHVAIRLDGVTVAENTVVYLADDATIYVSETDLDAWHLKYPLKPAFSRGGLDYFGLQTDLKLAAAYHKNANELDIVAGQSSFIGQPNENIHPITRGSGTFLNYNLKREYGSYDFYQTLFGGTFQWRELSVTQNGLQFYRGSTRLFWLDSSTHSAFQLGDATTNASWLGTPTSFGGIHWATDFTADPTYSAHGPPTVTGVAAAPSILEVYIDNLLELRRFVPQGPFTVRDLPASAANSEVVLVLTDERTAQQTTQVIRPTYDLSVLGQGRSSFSLDAGLAHEYAATPQSYYRGAVATGTFRYGLTDSITGELYAESINGHDFTDGGLDVQLGKNETFGFRSGNGSGNGNHWHESELRYKLSSGKFGLEERFVVNSETQPPFPGFDFQNALAQLSEDTSLSIAASDIWSTSLRLNRNRTNNGYDSSIISGRVSYRRGGFSIDFGPLYDFVQHRMSGSISLDWQLSPGRRLTERSEVTNSGQASSSLEYRKGSVNPSDPLSYDLKVASNDSQDRRVSASYTMPWANASFVFQKMYGKGVFEPEISGGLAYIDDQFYTLKTVGDSEAFGVLKLPELSNVPVSVNSREIGRTDRRGDVLLRDLSAFRDNVVDVALDDLPIDANIQDPQHFVPAKNMPVNLTAPVLSRGGLSLNVVDEHGVPLVPMTNLTTPNGRQFPIGYEGHAYLYGLMPGPLRLVGESATGPCSIELEIPLDLSTIPDLGRKVCQ